MRKIYYGWVIVGVSFVCFALSIGARFSFSIFYVAILTEFGWSRGMTAGAYSVGMLVYAFWAPVSGSLLDRFGPRIVFPFGALVLGAGLLLSSRISEVWHLFVLQGIVISIGISGLGFATNTAYIARWFRRRIGMANGIANAGIGFGLLFLGPTIQLIIEQDGWRHAYLLFGLLVPLLIAPMSFIFHRPSPASMGLLVDGVAEETLKNDSAPSPPSPTAPQTPAPPLREIFRSPKLLLMLPVAMAIGFNNNTIMIHFVAHLVDTGHGIMFAATSLGLVNVVRIFGSLLGGAASDRIGRLNAYLLGNICGAIGVFLFMNIGMGTPALYGFLLIYGLGLGALSPIYASLVADILPSRNLGLVLGIFEIVYGLSAAFGVWFAGAMFDRMGSYTLPFSLVLVFTGVACACVLGMGRIDRRARASS